MVCKKNLVLFTLQSFNVKILPVLHQIYKSENGNCLISEQRYGVKNG